MASRETFKPGLFGIGLNIGKRISNHYLDIESKRLAHYLEIEPIYTKSAICNMQAVLAFHMDSGRTEARLMLEGLVIEYPNDLNILADLIYVYKEMGSRSDSDRYEKQLASHKDDPFLQAKGILGQANALTYDLTDDHNKTSEALLKTIPEAPYGGNIEAKRIAVEKFEKGISMLENLECSPKEILVWKYNLGIARGRMDNWRSFAGVGSRSENCVKALEAYLDVIENLSPIAPLEVPLNTYVAKSNIFFAQLYLSRRDTIDKAQLSERIKSRDLDSMCHKALSLCPNDPTVLQRCARYQFNMNRYLEAIQLYDKSISLLPDIYINWFSYASRSEVCLIYATKLSKEKSNENQIRKYLELAYKDGKTCLQSKRTIICQMRMARICFERAMPDNESGVSFRCQHIDFIYEALETIHEAMNKQDLTKHSKIYYNLGMYYPYIGQYRKAIESLKTSLELNGWNKKFFGTFSNLCKCYVAFYERTNDKDLLGEFRFMLKEAKKRGCYKFVSNAIYMMCKDSPKMLTDLVQSMIDWDVRGCEQLIREVLKSRNWNLSGSARICRDLKIGFETKLQERKDQDSDINGPAEIQKSESTERFQYDFFVSHSEVDKDWVNFMLRPQLEELDEKVQGFIPSRDFVPGESTIHSILAGIEQSRKLLIVLTPNYLKDNWEKFISNPMIFSVIETKVNEKTIITIILEECDIPDELKPFPAISFTEISDWERLRKRLTVDMDSETTLEEGMSALTTCDIEED